MVIQEALSTLPENATQKDKRRAIRNAYPFGERKNWPAKAGPTGTTDDELGSVGVDK